MLLYTYPDNFRAFKALIAAQFSGAKVEVAQNFEFGVTNKSEEFLKKFPLGKVPALETDDGKYLVESNAIAYYVSNAQLRGASDFEKAEVLQWINFADSEIQPASAAWVYPIIGIIQFNKNTNERAKQDIARALEALQQRLVNNTFLVGERITLADIVVFCNLSPLFQHVADPSFRKPYFAVTRWFNTILNQPQTKAVIKNFKFCEKEAVFDPKKYQEFQAKHAGAGAQQQQCKKEKEKKEKQPAAEKPKKKEKEVEEAEELDAADEALLLEPKSKDPFDSLPKGTFNMDDFKRVYSNEDEAKSIPYFFEKFDAENYSIWFGEYKYPDELTKVFMSCNLITGMFQRLDKMRKQAFASCCLFGEDNNSTISGVWVWRGHELAFPLSPDWQIDYESYDWKKLDASSEETKKLVTQYFSWAGTDKNGRKFNQGKIFK
jgi:elongation factor 1-gamma